MSMACCSAAATDVGDEIASTAASSDNNSADVGRTVLPMKIIPMTKNGRFRPMVIISCLWN